MLHKKAFYNLLKLNAKRIESGELKIADIEPWQTANYRDFSLNELFSSLKDLGLELLDFERQAERYDSPEEMIKQIAKEKEPLEQDRLFLLIFELWRRLLPEKRALSIFCDELDYQISLFIQGQTHSFETLQDTLAYLQQIIAEHADKGFSPKRTFLSLQTFCAYNLESFLFDYILNQIETDNQKYASELLEGFKGCFQRPLWFDYLMARAEILDDLEEGYSKLETVIAKVNKEKSLELSLEILYFLAESGNPTLFHDLAIKIFPLLQTEEDFREFSEICFIHYEHLDYRQAMESIAEIAYKRRHILPMTPLPDSEADLQELRRVLTKRFQLASE